MAITIKLGNIPVNVTLKDIKNIHLSVYPPEGAVRISAPKDMAIDAIRVFAISKLDWIKKQQLKLRSQERETPREFLDRESHYLWGKRYLLEIIENDEPPKACITHRKIILQVRPNSSMHKRQSLLDELYRQQLKEAAAKILKQWEKKTGITISGFMIRRMKTRWGTCSPEKRTIRLNLELAKKPQECLEYIIVHEITHIIEPSHNNNFVELMNKFIPKWRFYREELNRLPVRHEDWAY